MALHDRISRHVRQGSAGTIPAIVENSRVVGSNIDPEHRDAMRQAAAENDAPAIVRAGTTSIDWAADTQETAEDAVPEIPDGDRIGLYIKVLAAFAGIYVLGQLFDVQLGGGS